jgi:fucose permease
MPEYSLIPVTIAGAFTVGMVLALLGSIKLPLAQRLGLDEPRVGGLLSALNLALIPMMLLGGILVDSLGIPWMLFLGSLMCAAGVFGLANSRTYAQCLGVILLVGAGAALLSTSSIKLMPAAFFGESKSAAASLNMGNVFFGLGALLTPTLADLLIRGLGYRRSVHLLAVCCLVPAAVIVPFTPAEAWPQKLPHGQHTDVFGSPILWLAGLVFLLYGPLENALGTWTTTYLTELGHRERRASLLLSGFWLTFMAARFVASFCQQSFLTERSGPWLILALALVTAVTLGNLAGTHSRTTAGWGVLIAGAALGPIFPTLVGVLFDHFAPEKRGTAYGAMFAMGATGSIVLAPLIGLSARRGSIRTALRIPTLVALLLAAATLVLGLTLSSLF